MPNVLHLTVENPDEILNAGAYAAGAVIRVQWSATQGGTYADLTGTGSTPTVAVVTLIRSYTAYDPAGVALTWYRWRFENAGATRLGAWSASFQAGDETAGLLCSLYDVKQELGITGTTDDEVILEKIAQVSSAIEHLIGQWMAPRPTDPASTMTLLFDVEWGRWAHRSLLLEYGDRLTGIRAVTAVGIAIQSQPETGGTYTAATVSDFFMRPKPTADGPALRLEITQYPTGSANLFYPGYNTVQVTGSFGFASVPADIQGVAIRAVVRRFIGKGGGGVAVATGPSGTEILLPDMSGIDRATISQYKIPNVG